jgi:DNA-binding SARP family transcriptional activator
MSVAAASPSLTALAARLGRTDLEMICVSAPAGFGKTLLARSLVTQHSSGAVCDVLGPDTARLARSVIQSLATEDPSRASATAQLLAGGSSVDEEMWRQAARDTWAATPTDKTTFVFDNLERAGGAGAAFLNELLAIRPSVRRVVLCSRNRLPRQFTRHVLPHLQAHVSARDMQLNLADISELLGRFDLQAVDAAEVQSICAGWPLAVLLLLRLLREGRTISEIRNLGASAYDGLFEFLVDDYVNSLEGVELRILLAAASLPNTTIEEIAIAAGIDLTPCVRFVRDCPFLVTSNATVSIHPLLGALLGQRFIPEQRVVRRQMAEHALRQGSEIRAAEIALADGDHEAAIKYLEQLPFESNLERTTQLSRIVAEFDAELIMRNPALWLALIQCRFFSMSTTRYLSEARRVYHALPFNAEERLRVRVAQSYCSALLYVGNSAEAIRTMHETIEQVQSEFAKSELRRRIALVHAKLGKFEKAYSEYLAESTVSEESMKSRASFMDEVDAMRAFRRGEYDRGMAMLEEALRLDRQTGWVANVVVSLSNIAAEALWQGDEQRFRSAVSEVGRTILPGMDFTFRYWLAAASDGFSAEPPDEQPHCMRPYAHLFVAANKGPYQVAAARLAVAESARIEDYVINVYALIALAEVSPSDRETALRKLREVIRMFDVEPFVTAVEAFAGGGDEIGLLRPWVERLRNPRLPREHINLDLTSGRIVKDGRHVPLSSREMAVLTYLSIGNRALSRDAICDAIWPETDPISAANNLKVVVHRIRKKLHGEAVLASASGYRLGDRILVGLRDDENMVRNAERESPLSADRIDGLRALVTRLRGRRPELLRWDWYAGVDHRLNELLRSALLVLGRDALARGDYVVARDISTELCVLDPADEEATELQLRVFVETDDDAAARRALRNFEKAVASDNAAIARMQEVLVSLMAANAVGR